MNGKPKLDDRFIMKIEGKEFVKYPGLLDLAHQKGICRIEVEALQYPTKDNGSFAICKAVVESKEGESFSDIGDANPENVNSRIAKHLLRMASTRAIARALRSFTNIGMTCLEELADFDEIAEEKPPKKPAPKEPAPAKPKAEPPKAEPPESNVKPLDSERPKMSEAQKKAIYNLAQRRGIPIDDLQKMANDSYGVNLQNMSSSDASSFIRNLQQAA
jgi:hypothetical protein